MDGGILRAGTDLRVRCGCYLSIVRLWDQPGGFSARVSPCAMHAVTGDPAGSLVACYPGGLYSREVFPDLCRAVWDDRTGARWL